MDSNLEMKQHSIDYANFRDIYKRDELKKIKIEQDRLGGVFSWVQTNDTIIYEAFLMGEQREDPYANAL